MSTDDACSRYILNISNLLGFSGKFETNFKKTFPFITPLNDSLKDNELELFELITDEKYLTEFLYEEFTPLGYFFKGCDPTNKTLILSTQELKEDAIPDEYGTYHVDDFKKKELVSISWDEIIDDIKGILPPEVPDTINEIMMIKKELNKSKSEIPLIDEVNYFRHKSNRGWFVELQAEFAHWLVEFFKVGQSRKYIQKCSKCEKFYIRSKNDNRIKNCTDCSGKSTLSRERRNEYMREYRKRQRQNKLSIKREKRIKNMMERTDYSREEVIAIIEADEAM